MASSPTMAGVYEPNRLTRSWKRLIPIPATPTGIPSCCTAEASKVHHKRYPYSPFECALARGSQMTARTPWSTSASVWQKSL